jgi:hypothetical protein
VSGCVCVRKVRKSAHTPDGHRQSLSVCLSVCLARSRVRGLSLSESLTVCAHTHQAGAAELKNPLAHPTTRVPHTDGRVCRSRADAPGVVRQRDDGMEVAWLGLGYRVSGFGFRVSGLGFRV